MSKFFKISAFLLINLGIASIIGSIGVFVFFTPPTKAQSADQKEI